MDKGHAHKEFIAHYENIRNSLFTYLMYRVNFERPQAEDLMMDIVLKAYMNYKQFNPDKGSFKNWLFTIARHHLINTWRRHHEKPISLEALEEEGMSPAANSIDDTVSGSFHHRNIQRVLFLMSEPDREIITLRYLNELGLEEIGDVLHKSAGAIRTQLSRALHHFKSLYQKLYPQPL